MRPGSSDGPKGRCRAGWPVRESSSPTGSARRDWLFPRVGWRPFLVPSRRSGPGLRKGSSGWSPSPDGEKFRADHCADRRGGAEYVHHEPQDDRRGHSGGLHRWLWRVGGQCRRGSGAWRGADTGFPARDVPTSHRHGQHALTTAHDEIVQLEGELAAAVADNKVNPLGRTPEDVARRIKQLRSRLDEAEQLLDRAQTEFDKTREVWGHLPPKLPVALEPLQGSWRVVSISSEGRTINSEKQNGYPDVKISGSTLSLPYRDASAGWRNEKTSIAVDDSKMPKTIDLIASGKPVGRGIYEFTAPATTCVSCHSLEGAGFKPPLPNMIGLCGPGLKRRTGLRLAIALEGERPKQFGGNGVIVFNLERIEPKPAPTTPGPNLSGLKREYQRALKSVEEKRVAHSATLIDLDVAKARVEEAVRELQVEEERLKEAFQSYRAAEQKAEGGGTKRTTDGNVFTIRVRPVMSPERVIRVPATGKETILEGLAYAAEDMAIKPEALSVWVVREKAILPVDLVAIVQRGDGKTNFTLKAGDQLFVQVRVAK